MRIFVETTPHGRHRLRAEQPDGTLITIDTYDDRDQADVACAELRAERSRQKPRVRSETVGSWLNTWAAKRSEKDQRRIALHILSDPIARVALRPLRKRDVRRFRDRLASKPAFVRSKGGKHVAHGKLSPKTQREVYALLRGALKAAVEREKLRHNPALDVASPSGSKRKALQYLYPEEVARLVTCSAVPFQYRILYGFLAHEGMRVSEALGLTWGELQLAHRMIVLDENKTDDPRSWALGDDVARVLVQWKERRADTGDDDRVFVGAKGCPLNTLRCAAFRRHLRLAGVNRVDLFTRTEARQPIRVHDLRATFVTLSLAAGRHETWVTDCTGHTTNDMLVRYRRLSRTVKEVGLGWLWPLDRLLFVSDPLAQKAIHVVPEESGNNEVFTVGEGGFEALTRPGFPSVAAILAARGSLEDLAARWCDGGWRGAEAAKLSVAIAVAAGPLVESAAALRALILEGGPHQVRRVCALLDLLLDVRGLENAAAAGGSHA